MSQRVSIPGIESQTYDVVLNADIQLDLLVMSTAPAVAPPTTTAALAAIAGIGTGMLIITIGSKKEHLVSVRYMEASNDKHQSIRNARK